MSSLDIGLVDLSVDSTESLRGGVLCHVDETNVSPSNAPGVANNPVRSRSRRVVTNTDDNMVGMCAT